MNPTKKANTKALINHLDMIKTHADRNRDYSTDEEEEEEEDAKPHATNRAVDADTHDAVQRVVSTCKCCG